MISPLVRWEHSEDRYVVKYTAEVTLQFSFENYLPYLTINALCHNYEDQSHEIVQINITYKFWEPFDTCVLSVCGLLVLNAKTHAML